MTALTGGGDPVPAADDNADKDKPDKDGDEKADEKTPAAVAVPYRFDETDHYRTGLEQLRSTATWMITALAAVAAAIFGGGPLVAAGDITSDGFKDRVIWLVVCAVVGAGAVAYMIGRFARVLAPSRMSLDNLPQSVRDDIEADPHGFLPAGAQTVEEFRSWRQSESIAARKTQLVIDQDTGQITELERKEKAGTATDAEKSELASLRSKVSMLRSHLPVFRENIEINERAKSYLLVRGEYDVSQDKLRTATPLVLIAAVVAVVAAIGYIAAWKWQPEESPTPTKIATLTRADNDAGEALWQAAGLRRCARDGTISVLVDGGDGTPDSPYQVRTTGTDRCPLVSFTVIDAAAAVVLPKAETIKIEYEEDDEAEEVDD